jgi:hypothetical protein
VAFDGRSDDDEFLEFGDLVSTPKYRVIWALGQPTQLPVRRTLALLSTTSTSSMSPPSLWIRGRMRSRTDCTRSRVTI